MPIKLVALSDTHWTYQKDPVGNSLQSLQVPDGDILVHAGDATFMGKQKEWYAFYPWWTETGKRFKNRIIVPGNHDYNFRFVAKTFECQGLKFGMLPYVPNLPQWNFSAEEWEIKLQLESIGKVDVLISHGPPRDILDYGGHADDHYGSTALREFLLTEQKPRVLICGHVHDGHGYKNFNGVECYNVAVCNDMYWMVRPPTVIEVEV